MKSDHDHGGALHFLPYTSCPHWMQERWTMAIYCLADLRRLHTITGMRALTRLLSLLGCAALTSVAAAAEVETQPFLAAVQTVLDSAESLGSPFIAEEKAALEACVRSHTAQDVVKAQAILDKHCLFVVNISPEQRVKVAAGAAKAELDEAGWRQFLVRVDNEAGVTAKLQCTSPFAKPGYVPGSPPVAPNAQPKDPGPPALEARWLDLQMFEAPPMKPTLSGLGVEYRIVQLYSRDAGSVRQASRLIRGRGRRIWVFAMR